MQVRPVAQFAVSVQSSFTSQSPGTQTLRFSEPPPLERQMKSGPTFFWQYSSESVTPPSATSSFSQLKKHIFWPADSNGEQTCRRLVLHSPSTAQQSSSTVHTCVQ